MKCRLTILAALALTTALPAQTKTAELGECRLELGGVIQGCRVAYRTFGTYDEARNNAVLIPTWFASRADDWLPLLGSSGAVDTTGFYVVVIESLGAGASSSPTSSRTQRGLAFPELTIGDMVEAAYRLARDVLHLPRVRAIVGHSMGGMQAFEWGVAHPDYADRIVAISGNPRQWTHGLSFWELIVKAADDGVRERVPRDTALTTIARLFNIGGTSPAQVNRQAPTNYALALQRQAESFRSFNLFEWAWHGRAILRHDVSRRFGGDMTRAAQAWKARALIVAATFDHSVDPEPALAFARLIHADTVIMPSPAGHSAIFGDAAAKAAVRKFIAQ